MNAALAETTITNFNYPLNERVRVYLRLEYLFLRLQTLLTRTTAIDHHYAILTLFEITELGARTDLRGDLLKDLERQRGLLASYRENPQINALALETLLADFGNIYEKLHHQTGRIGQNLLTLDWLNSIRSRIHIPGGTCEFDLPSYFAWQHSPSQERLAELQRIQMTLDDYAHSVFLVLGVLRDSMVWQEVSCKKGQYQQILPPEKSFQLAMVQLPTHSKLYPTVSGSRLMLSVRLHALGDSTPPETLQNFTFMLGLSS